MENKLYKDHSYVLTNCCVAMEKCLDEITSQRVALVDLNVALAKIPAPAFENDVLKIREVIHGKDAAFDAVPVTQKNDKSDSSAN